MDFLGHEICNLLYNNEKRDVIPKKLENKMLGLIYLHYNFERKLNKKYSLMNQGLNNKKSKIFF